MVAARQPKINGGGPWHGFERGPSRGGGGKRRFVRDEERDTGAGKRPGSQNMGCGRDGEERERKSGRVEEWSEGRGEERREKRGVERRNRRHNDNTTQQNKRAKGGL